MQVNISFDRPDEGPRSGPVMVGWFLTTDKGAPVLVDGAFRPAMRRIRQA